MMDVVHLTKGRDEYGEIKRIAWCGAELWDAESHASLAEYRTTRRAHPRSDDCPKCRKLFDRQMGGLL